MHLHGNYVDKMPWHSEYFNGEKQALIDLVNGMLSYDYTSRVAASQIMQDSFLQEEDSTVLQGLAGRGSDCPEEHRTALLGRLVGYSKLAKSHQVILSTVADHANPAEVANLARTFRHIDADHIGMLSKRDLIVALQNCSSVELTAVEKQYISDLFKTMDLDGTGHITYTEWLAATVGASVLRSSGAVRMAFWALDCSGNDCITQEDLASAFGECEAESIMQLRSKDAASKSGDIFFEEFKGVVEGITAQRIESLRGFDLSEIIDDDEISPWHLHVRRSSSPSPSLTWGRQFTCFSNNSVFDDLPEPKAEADDEGELKVALEASGI